MLQTDVGKEEKLVVLKLRFYERRLAAHNLTLEADLVWRGETRPFNGGGLHANYGHRALSLVFPSDRPFPPLKIAPGWGREGDGQ